MRPARTSDRDHATVTTLLADLGGTRLKSGLLRADGSGPREVCGLPHSGDWLGALRRIVAEHQPDRLALCVPGLVEDGVVTALPGKLEGLVGADLPALLGVAVPLLVNDAIAYGVGEAVCGAGRSFARVVVVTLGTGVGVAVIEDGRPLGRGPLGAGLLGGQLPLGDGRTLEQACCAAAFAATTGALDVPGGVLDRDPVILAGVDTYRADLARALTVLCLAHAPDVVVVGGGVAQTPDLLVGVGDAVRSGLWPEQTVEVRLADRVDAAALDGLAVLLRTVAV